MKEHMLGDVIEGGRGGISLVGPADIEAHIGRDERYRKVSICFPGTVWLTFCFAGFVSARCLLVFFSLAFLPLTALSSLILFFVVLSWFCIVNMCSRSSA